MRLKGGESFNCMTGILEQFVAILAGGTSEPRARAQYLERSLLNGLDRKANQQFYDETAAIYASERAWQPKTRDSIRENLLSRLIDGESSILQPGASVLVVGAGTGSDQELLKNFGMNVVGIDLSHSMLLQAEERVDDHLAQAEAVRLPFAEGTFDFVYCEAAGEHFDVRYLAKFLEEVERVVDIQENRPADALISVRQGDGRVVEIIDVIGGQTYPKFFSTYRISDVQSIFEDCGVNVVEQWEGVGGTPGVESAFPWINNLIQFTRK